MEHHDPAAVAVGAVHVRRLRRRPAAGSWGGSPWWYLAWTVALCVLAVLGALLKGAEGEDRTRLFRMGLVVGVVGLVFVALGVATGPEPTLSTPSGVSPLTKAIG